VAIEVSTAGLRKPVGQIYPARELLDMCLAAERPVALSSDAHRPEQLGFDYERAVEWLRGAGVERIATFDRRERAMEPLG
jgi:histidinol-phosphatase (PHP family)